MTAAPALAGRRVLVTRGAEKGDELQRRLVAAGAEAVSVPMIATEPLADASQIRAALARLRATPAPSWVVFGSATAVGLVAAGGAGELAGLRCAAVGPATASALLRVGVRPELVPTESTAVALARELGTRLRTGGRVLVFAAEGGSFDRASLWPQAHIEVETLQLYRTVMPSGAAATLAAALPEVDAVVFTSASTVRHTAAALAGRQPPMCPAVCIGEPTAQAARAAAWTEVVVAAQATPSALMAAILQRLTGPQPLP